MAKKKVTNKSRILVSFIHDRSGSMNETWNENLNGFKVFVDDLRKNADVDYRLSLTVFDTQVISVLTAEPLSKVDPAILAKYGPAGGTALYDALGVAFEATDRLQSDFDKIIYVIVTDGEENSSRTWTKERINAAVDERLQGGKTTFQYLGSQPETWDDAKAAGFTAGQTVVYDTSNAFAMYSAVADGLNNFASSKLSSTRSMTGNFADETMIRSANLHVVQDRDTTSGT